MSKIKSNGRSTVQELKKKFKAVFLHYTKKEDGTVKTTAFLVEENAVHVGVSLFSNRGDQFNKSRGRQMALGRAEHAYNVSVGTETSRQTHASRRQELSFTIVTKNGETVDNLVESLLK
jgi:hypothetical protein